MSEDPRKLLLRRSDVCRWVGISEDEFEKLTHQGIVRGFALRPGGRHYYHREHIREMIINKGQEQ